LPIFCLLLLPILAFPVFAQSGGESAPKGPPPAPVVTAPVQEEQVGKPLTLVGTTEPRYEAAVAADEEGRVEALAARRGERVEQGEQLVRLRTRPLELQLQEALARRREIDARIAQAKADAERARKLFAQKFISEQELQALTTEVQTLRRQQEQAGAEIRLVRDRLSNMAVRAPFSGQVMEENTEIGQWLNTGDPVVVLADLSVVHVMTPVPEQQLGGIKMGDEVGVRFDALPGREFPGEVTAIIPQADPATRTFPVQVSVPNPQGRILAGMLARVTFSGNPRRALLIPKDALIPQPGGGGQVAKVADGRAVIFPVQVEGAYGSRYAVTPLEGELAPGDRVVIRGNERLRPGQAVAEKDAQ